MCVYLFTVKGCRAQRKHNHTDVFKEKKVGAAWLFGSGAPASWCRPEADVGEVNAASACDGRRGEEK